MGLREEQRAGWQDMNETTSWSPQQVLGKCLVSNVWKSPNAGSQLPSKGGKAGLQGGIPAQQDLLQRGGAAPWTGRGSPIYHSPHHSLLLLTWKPNITGIIYQEASAAAFLTAKKLRYFCTHISLRQENKVEFSSQRATLFQALGAALIHCILHDLGKELKHLGRKNKGNRTSAQSTPRGR